MMNKLTRQVALKQRLFWLPVGIALACGGLVCPALSADHLCPDTGYRCTLVAKAPVDECFNGIGGEYVVPEPGDVTGITCPHGTTPKRNGDNVWGMTTAGNSVWWGTVANLGCIGQAAGAIAEGYQGGSVDEPPPNPNYVCEGMESQYPLPPGTSPLIRELIGGDWRPPQFWVYDLNTKQVENVTPKDPLVNRTIGLRAAGSANGVVLLAGPTVFGISIFAFDADTKAFLESRYFPWYTNIRSWTEANGGLYTAVQNAAGGGGTVLRWMGNKRNPLAFTIVGQLDNEGADLAAHAGRLYVGTWPGSQLSSLGSLFAESPPAGVWMSPPLGRTGLRFWDRTSWTKVFSVDRYEPDPLIATTYAIGSLTSFEGYLYFGTMHVPAPLTAAVLKEEYGSEADIADPTEYRRAFAAFRSNVLDHLDAPELLYGEDIRSLPRKALPASATFATDTTTSARSLTDIFGWVPENGVSGFQATKKARATSRAPTSGVFRRNSQKLPR
jgi:hypothetical protein